MRTGWRMALLVLAAGVVSNAQKTTTKTNGTVWDRPISFSTKSRDSCTMVVIVAGDHTRLRVSCKGPSPPQTQPQTRSYYCDFQGKPNLCRAYNTNPRHYFTQMMWDMRKLNHACQGPSVYRPLMCKKGSDEAQMTFLASWPKHTTPKPAKTGQVQRKPAPAQPKVPKVPSIPRPVKPQPQPHPGKGTVGKKPTSRPTSRPTTRPTTRPTEQGEAKAARLANEYCWKSFHGICTYLISWFQN